MKGHGRQRIALLFAAATVAWLAVPARAEPAAPPEPPLRFGMSARVIAGINRADAIASLKIWIQTIAADQGLQTEATPSVFDRPEDFAAALAGGEIDILTAPTDEYFALERAAPLANPYATTMAGSPAVEYVLLVRADSPLRTLADLRGVRLQQLAHPTASLADIWLAVELARAGLPAPAAFFREITPADKVNLAILPVFFGKVEAGLVTRHGFALAGELNPQVLKQLRVIATSPPLIPTLTSHRTALPADLTRRFREAALNMADTPAGRQVLNLFQNDSFKELSAEELAPTRALLEEHDRLAAGLRGQGRAP